MAVSATALLTGSRCTCAEIWHALMNSARWCPIPVQRHVVERTGHMWRCDQVRIWFSKGTACMRNVHTRVPHGVKTGARASSPEMARGHIAHVTQLDACRNWMRWPRCERMRTRASRCTHVVLLMMLSAAQTQAVEVFLLFYALRTERSDEFVRR